MLHILAFLKAPRAGLVKTRLASDLGPERACAAYKALVERQLQALPGDARVEIHFTPADAENEMRDWLGKAIEYYPQSEGGLGIRLKAAVTAAYMRGAKTVACIGGDCPRLEARHFQESMDMIGSGKDVVFGPSEDGGYYLIALASEQAELFEGIPWSEPGTLKASIHKAKVLGLEIGQLESLYDVDEATELERAIAEGHISI